MGLRCWVFLLGEKSAFEGQMIVKDTWQVCCVIFAGTFRSFGVYMFYGFIIIDELVMFPIIAVLQLSVCHIMSLKML